MKNTIAVTIEFSYQGNDYKPQSVLDLDQIMETSGHIPNLYMLLARENDIDTYSYLYEVMESSELHFDNANGIAEECVIEGSLDIEKFEARWHEQYVTDALSAIAKRYMKIENPKTLSGLNDALFAAYQLGKDAAPRT